MHKKSKYFWLIQFVGENKKIVEFKYFITKNNQIGK